jgi:hypothetical protein
MSAKSIFEADGKAIINYHLTRAPVIKPTPLPASATHNAPSKLAALHFAADADVKGVLDQAEATYPWLLTPGSKFVAKPDQLIKRRGKSGLLALNKTWAEAREWIEARAGKPQRVETVDGVLRQFLVEPFVPHPQDTEYYININSVREVCAIPSFSSSFSFQVVLGPFLDASSLSFGGRGECIFACVRRKAAARVGTESWFNHTGRSAWFCLKPGRTKGTRSRPTSAAHLRFAIRTYLSHAIFLLNAAYYFASLAWSNFLALVLRLFAARRSATAQSCQSFSDLRH